MRISKIFLFIFLIVLLVGSCAKVENKKNRESQSNFEFTKTEELIAPPASMAMTNYTIGAYYTTLVKMDSVKGFPYEYALYFSTDHARDNGGIWLYLCNGAPTNQANWVSYDDAVAQGAFDYLKTKPQVNPIYIDTIKGFQTETPHANVINGKVYLTYHNNLGHDDWQATMLSISDDGVNFKRIFDDDRGNILPPIELLNHTGYFRWGPNPFSGVNYKYIGYSLRKGTMNYRSAMWGSDDAIKWNEMKRINGLKTNKAIEGEERFIVWHGIDPSYIRKINDNEYVILTTGGTPAAGAMKRTTELYEIFVAPDGVTQTRMARKVVGIGHSTGYDAEECASPAMVMIGDSLHLLYVGTTASGKINTVMGAVGTFNKDAPLTTSLTKAHRQYHFYTNEEFDKDMKLFWEKGSNSVHTK